MTCCDVNSLPSSYIPIVLMFDYSENKTMHTRLSRAMKDGKKVNYYLLLLLSMIFGHKITLYSLISYFFANKLPKKKIINKYFVSYGR